MIKCIDCYDCKQIGRQRTTRKSIGRKRYYCTHPDMKNMKDKHNFPHHNFIGFGECNEESPLTIKTSPRWCPKKLSSFVGNINAQI